MQQPGEPTVEEILDSIKKVIARDHRDSASLDRRPKGASAKPPSVDDGNESDEVLELAEEIAISEDPPAEAEEREDGPDALIRAGTRESMRQNFAALSMLAKPGKQPQIVRSGETSLEGLTRELLRPMLAQWLDENLPEMVEDLVKAEIARIAGKRS